MFEFPKGRRLRKAELLIRRPPRGIGEINFLLLLPLGAQLEKLWRHILQVPVHNHSEYAFSERFETRTHLYTYANGRKSYFELLRVHREYCHTRGFPFNQICRRHKIHLCKPNVLGKMRKIISELRITPVLSKNSYTGE